MTDYKIDALVSLLLRRGYYPVAPECAGEGAQLINGQWHMPRWGCDTLQHVLEEHGDDGCSDPDQTLTAIAELKDLQKMEPQQLRKIHPLDFPIEVFLADLTTRPANIIRAELASFASYAGTGTFDIEPPFTVRHLCMFSRSEMRKWPNFGRKCLNEVEEMLRARGLQLWENHDERSLRLLREHKEYFK